MVKKNKDDEYDIGKINNMWEFLAYFFRYIVIRHLWKIIVFIVITGLIYSGYKLNIGGFNFEKEQIKVKAVGSEIPQMDN